MKKSYFTLEELICSSIAKQYGIDNTPSPKIIQNLEYVISRLNPIRELYGHPIYVNSGYRNEKLNKMVGGSKRSFHLQGLAVDLTTGSKEGNKELFGPMRAKFQFDLLIDE